MYILTCSHREESLPEGPHLNLLLYTRNTTGSKARNPKGSYNLSAIYAFISWSAYEDVFYVVGSSLSCFLILTRPSVTILIALLRFSRSLHYLAFVTSIVGLLTYRYSPSLDREGYRAKDSSTASGRSGFVKW